uniref:Uncharacterized protein n=1 Tax=Rhizophora mucronata TaxID=61149 RepID=A0A2P2JBE6_RHIMU
MGSWKLKMQLRMILSFCFSHFALPDLENSYFPLLPLFRRPLRREPGFSGPLRPALQQLPSAERSFR